tara:strand:+ start:137 stop:445 length:309 start_codon:yes stop_codon:yes gene_type:complete
LKGVGWYCHSATPVKIWIEEILLWFGCCSLDVEVETATPVEIWIEEFLVGFLGDWRHPARSELTSFSLAATPGSLRIREVYVTWRHPDGFEMRCFSEAIERE